MGIILIGSINQLAINLGENYLVIKNGNERLGKQKLDLVIPYVLWKKLLRN